MLPDLDELVDQAASGSETGPNILVTGLHSQNSGQMGHALPLLLRETTEFLHSSTYYRVYFGQKRPVLGWNEGFTGITIAKDVWKRTRGKFERFSEWSFQMG